MSRLLPKENLRSPAAVARLVITLIVGLGLDLWTKRVAFERLPAYPNGRYKFLPGWLEFTTTINPGAVFGLGEGQRVLFLAVSVAAILFLLYLFANSGRQRFYQVVVGMLLAGVLGNMYDRIRFGHVRDMLHMLPGWKWRDLVGDHGWSWVHYDVFPWIFNV